MPANLFAAIRPWESCQRIHSPLFARGNHAGEFIRRYSPLRHSMPVATATVTWNLRFTKYEV